MARRPDIDIHDKEDDVACIWLLLFPQMANIAGMLMASAVNRFALHGIWDKVVLIDEI